MLRLAAKKSRDAAADEAEGGGEEDGVGIWMVKNENSARGESDDGRGGGGGETGDGRGRKSFSDAQVKNSARRSASARRRQTENARRKYRRALGLPEKNEGEVDDDLKAGDSDKMKKCDQRSMDAVSEQGNGG